MTIPVKGTFAFDWAAQPDYPSWGSAQFKQNLNARDEELKSALNAVANMLNSTAVGVGGADNIGATAPTGLTGVTVQAILEALKTVIDTHTADITLAHGINNYAKTVQPAWTPIGALWGQWTLAPNPSGYYKDSLGRVYVEFGASCGNTDYWTAGTQLTTVPLPVGYRPSATMGFMCMTNQTLTDHKIIPIMVGADGIIRIGESVSKANISIILSFRP